MGFNGLDAVINAASILQSQGRSDIHILFIGDGRQGFTRATSRL